MREHLLCHRKTLYIDGAFLQMREICTQICLKGIRRSVTKCPADDRLRNSSSQKGCGKVMAKDMESFPVAFGLPDACSFHDPDCHVANTSVFQSSVWFML